MGYTVGMPMISTANGRADGSPECVPEQRLGRLLHLAQKCSARALRAELEPFGITPVQFAVLSELYRCDGLSLNAIAERLRADPPTVCGVIDCLTASGYVQRREDPEDRRRLRLYLTDKAQEMKAELAAADGRRIAALTRWMSEEELDVLKDLLRRLVKGAEKGCAA